MKYPARIYYTETDKALLWDRWQKVEILIWVKVRFRPKAKFDGYRFVWCLRIRSAGIFFH